MNSLTFNAPWGKTLRWMSAFSIVLLVVVCLIVMRTNLSGPAWFAAALPPVLLAGAALFVVRDYTITPTQLLIRRLFWSTRVSLAGLKSATFQPEAMRGSLRLWGNGGMFSITGWYRNSALGIYRAYVTDLNRTVVLQVAAKTVVVSPENPEQFVSQLVSITQK